MEVFPIETLCSLLQYEMNGNSITDAAPTGSNISYGIATHFKLRDVAMEIPALIGQLTDSFIIRTTFQSIPRSNITNIIMDSQNVTLPPSLKYELYFEIVIVQ